MGSRLFNKEIVRKAVTTRFWDKDNKALFASEFQIEYPNAAPGIPQVMDEFEVSLYFSWLKDTITSWEVELEELYGTEDPDVFWAVSYVRANVVWGGNNGLLETKRFSRYHLKDGKIVLLREMSNPLKWLEAAGRDLPIFRMDIYHEKVEAELARGTGDPRNGNDENLDISEAAVHKRIVDNLNAFMCEDYWKTISTQAAFTSDLIAKVWFLPPEMKEYYPPEMAERVEIWSQLSCPTINFDHRGKVWATDDPHIFFCEYKCSGITDWLGNNCPNSRYRNHYFYILRFNDAGQIYCCEEILNPINKYNSVNISVPTFPYYY